MRPQSRKAKREAVTVWAVALACTACLACSDSPPAPAEIVVQVESFPVDLLAGYTFFEQERLTALPDALAAEPRDVICLHNVMRDAQKQVIADAVRATYPYAYWMAADLTMGPDDPTDQHGALPSAPNTPPCSGETAELGEAAADCLQDNCSPVEGRSEGHSMRLSCATSSCGGSLAPLFASEPGRRCLSCLQAGFVSNHAFDKIRAQCSGDRNAGLAFDGNTTSMLLSRHPIDTARARTILLPSSLFRRQLIHAPIHIAGASVNVACATLTTPYSSTFITYGGVYGDGATGSEAWVNELRLQIERTLQGLRTLTDGEPAVLLALDEASVREERDGQLLVRETLGAPMFALLDAHLDVAVPADYAPRCTFCDENPMARAPAPGTWTHRIWLSNLSPSHVQTAARTRMDRIVPVPSDPDVDVPEDGLVPLSRQYGLTATVVIPK